MVNPDTNRSAFGITSASIGENIVKDLAQKLQIE